MKFLLCIYLISSFQVSFQADNKINKDSKITEQNRIECTENGCKGKYSGFEFINGKDIAHQFSNKMSNSVGNKLKELYRKKNYKKVDFSRIEMTTQGMGSGKVIYILYIPFISVDSKCKGILHLTTLEVGIINQLWRKEKRNLKM